MGKSYTEQLEEWVKNRAANTHQRNMSAFLRAADDVRAALQAGYPAKIVWTNLYEAKRVPFGYHAFLRYVRRFIPELQVTRAKSPPRSKTNKPGSNTMQKAGTTEPGFTFNPVPKKEDLL